MKSSSSDIVLVYFSRIDTFFHDPSTDDFSHLLVPGIMTLMVVYSLQERVHKVHSEPQSSSVICAKKLAESFRYSNLFKRIKRLCLSWSLNYSKILAPLLLIPNQSIFDLISQRSRGPRWEAISIWRNVCPIPWPCLFVCANLGRL